MHVTIRGSAQLILCSYLKYKRFPSNSQPHFVFSLICGKLFIIIIIRLIYHMNPVYQGMEESYGKYRADKYRA